MLSKALEQELLNLMQNVRPIVSWVFLVLSNEVSMIIAV